MGTRRRLPLLMERSTPSWIRTTALIVDPTQMWNTLDRGMHAYRVVYTHEMLHALRTWNTLPLWKIWWSCALTSRRHAHPRRPSVLCWPPCAAPLAYNLNRSGASPASRSEQVSRCSFLVWVLLLFILLVRRTAVGFVKSAARVNWNIIHKQGQRILPSWDPVPGSRVPGPVHRSAAVVLSIAM